MGQKLTCSESSVFATLSLHTLEFRSMKLSYMAIILKGYVFFFNIHLSFR